MSRTVDERVVEMRFDNENFEKNAKQSLSTLEKLKNALSFKGAADGLRQVDSAARATNLSALASTVENVGSKFSALEVIGITALVRITNRAIDLGSALVRSLSIDQVSAGWQKFADKTTAVQTIMAATASQFSDTETQMAAVNAQLEKLNWFTDETSYNFVDMVGNIGKFTSNNIGLETSVTAMQGIATWAAISGANANEASRAMYNLSQAIGVGAVTALDWRSIENANMATAEFKKTAIETAVALGELKQVGDGVYQTMKGTEVSVSNFREGLSDKWFTNDVLTKTLNKYGEFTDKLNSAFEETGKLTADILSDIEKYKNGERDFKDAVDDTSVSAERYSQILAELSDESMDFGRKAFIAAQETKTFAEVIDYTKDAVSSQWMNIFESIFGEYVSAKKLWTSVAEDFYTLFVEPLENAAGVIDEAFRPKWKDLTDQITKAGVSMDEFKTAVGESFDGGAEGLDALIEKYGSFEAAVASGQVSSTVLGNALKGLLDKALGAADATNTVTTSLVNLEDVVKRVIRGEFGNGQKRIEALTQAGYDYATVQDLVNKTLAGQVVNYETTTTAMTDLSNLTDEQRQRLEELRAELGDDEKAFEKFFAEVQRPSGRELFTGALQDGLQIIIRSIAIVKGAWHDVFPATTSEQIYHFLEVIKKFTSGTLTGLDKNADKIGRTLRGIFNVLDLIVRLFKGAFRLSIKLINRILEQFNLNIWDVTAAIGDWLTNLHDVILGNKEATGIIDTLIDCLANAVGSVVRFVQKFNLMDRVRTLMTRIGKTMKVTCKSMGDFFKIVGRQLREFMGHWRDLDHFDLSTLKAMLLDFKATVIDKIFDVSEVKAKLEEYGGVITDYFSHLGSNINMENTPVMATLGKIFGGIKDFIAEKIGFEDILMGAVVGVDLYAMTKLFKAITSFGDLAAVFKNVGTAAVTALGSIAKYFKRLILVADSKIVLNVAIAIGILAASLIALAYMVEKHGAALDGALWRLGVLAGILAVLAVAVGFMNKLSGGASALNTIGIAGIAIAILIIADALKSLSEISKEEYLSAVGRFIQILVVLLAAVTFLAMVTKVAKGSLNPYMDVAAILGIVAIAVAMRILVDAIVAMKEKLSGLNIAELWDQLTLLFAMLGATAVASRIAGKGGFGLLAVIAAVWLLLEVLDKIANLDMAKIHANIAAFQFVINMLIAMMASSILAGKFVKEAGQGLLMMAISIVVLLEAIKMIADMRADVLAKGALIIGALMVFIGYVVAMSHFAGREAAQAGKMLLMMAVAIGIIVGIMYLIAILSKDEAGLKKAMQIITQLSVIFGAIMLVAHKAGEDNGAIKMLTLMAIIVGLIGGILIALAAINNPEAVKSASMAISLVMGTLGAVLFTISKINGSNIKMGPLITMSAIVAILAGILLALSALNVQTALPNAEALSLLLVSFTASMLILSQVKGIPPGAAKALLELAGIVGIIAVVIAAIGAGLALLDGGSGQVVSTLEQGVEIMGLVGEALGAFLGGIVAGGLEALSQSFVTMAENFVTACEHLAVIGQNKDMLTGCTALAEMMLVFGAAELLDSINNILSLGGLLSGESSVSDFVDKLKEFADGIKDIEDPGQDKITAAENLAKVGTALAEFANTISRSGGLLQDVIGEKDLSNFGEMCADFAASIDSLKAYDITEDDITRAKNIADCGQYFADFANNVAPVGGIIQDIFGEIDLTEFGIDVENFADSLDTLKAYDITEDDITRAKNIAAAGKHFADFANNVAPSGGLIATLVGEVDIAEFGKKCNKFAEKIADLPKITQDHVDTSEVLEDIGDNLIDFSDTMEDGEDEIEFLLDNAEDFVDFAEAACDFADEIDWFPTISAEKVNGLTSLPDIAEALLDLSDTLYGEDDTISWAVENADMFDDIVGGPQKLASAINKFPGVSPFKVVSVSLLSTALTSLVEAVTIVSDSSDKIKNTSDNDLIGSLADTITKSVDPLSQMGEALAAADFESIKTNLNGFSGVLDSMIRISENTKNTDSKGLVGLVNAFKDIGNSGISALTGSLKNGASDTESSIKNFVSSTIAGLKNHSPKFKNAGRDLAKSIGDGMRGYNFGNVKSTLGSMMSQMASAIRSYHSQFYQSGVYLLQGYINGIMSKQQAVHDAAYRTGQTAIRGLRKGQAEGSPSRLTFISGKFFGQGFINGIVSMYGVAEDAAEKMAVNSIASVTDTLARAKNIAGNSAFEMVPTVRPVVDVSSAASSAGKIRSMLSGMSGMTAYINEEANANSVVLDYISGLDRANSRRNNDVVNAIMDLHKEFQDLGDRIDNLEMVMDSGEVVGALTNKMDRAFGKKVSRRNRGV